MKKIFSITFLFCCFCTYKISNAQGTWTQKADFPATKRYGAVGFSIGSKGYVGTGYDGNINFGDFWEYDPSSNSWTQKASISARRAASAFSIGSKGYVTCGIGSAGSFLTDIMEYDPSNNTWVSKTTFPGTPRYGAAGFAIGNKGYIGCGNEGSASGPYTNEFWSFDPTANTWAQKASFPGSARYGLTQMGGSINNKGYMGFGYNGTALNDLYEYDPTNNSWTQKATFPSNGRSYGVSFASCYKYFAGTGQENGIAKNDIWQYDPSNNTWTQAANFGGGDRWLMTSCVINGRAFVGTGYDFTNYYNDWWEYGCSDQAVLEQSNTVNYTSLFPTTFSNEATLEINTAIIHKTEIHIFDITGRLVKQDEIVSKKSIIQKGNLSQGIYSFEVISDNAKIGWGKFIIE